MDDTIITLSNEYRAEQEAIAADMKRQAMALEAHANAVYAQEVQSKPINKIFNKIMTAFVIKAIILAIIF